MKKVIIASKNPVKINAVKRAFEKVFPTHEFSFEGVSVESGVGIQPMTNHETLQGAINRCTNAYQMVKDADFWVGIEGGVEEDGRDFESFAWVVVRNLSGEIGKSITGTFFLPQKITDLIKQGKELGEADDIVFGNSNSKQKDGTVGALTKGVITRTKYYEEAVVLALIPFIQQELY